ncbi:hypothetical protein Btru_030544 [Bulinus truncatus]|nr:hypothetical protein Btru_030544 [Bulinus truncatus]
MALPLLNSSDFPPLDQSQNTSCSYERPKLCAPKGACCRISQHCRAGVCEPCLPADVTSLPRGRQLTWCRDHGQRNVSLMASDTCRLACYDLFTPEEMKKSTSVASGDNKNGVPCVDQDLRLSNIAIACSSVALALVGLIIIVLLVCKCVRRPRKFHVPVELKTRVIEETELNVQRTISNTSTFDGIEANNEETNTATDSVPHTSASQNSSVDVSRAEIYAHNEPGPSTKLIETCTS